MPEDSPAYKDFMIERLGYNKHVVANKKECQARPCYVREMVLPNGGEILVLSTLQ